MLSGKELKHLLAPLQRMQERPELKGITDQEETQYKSSCLSKTDTDNTDKSLWLFPAMRWLEVAQHFGFDLCWRWHNAERMPYNRTTCEEGTSVWQHDIGSPRPGSDRCTYKARVIYDDNNVFHLKIEDKDKPGKAYIHPLTGWKKTISLHVTVLAYSKKIIVLDLGNCLYVVGSNTNSQGCFLPITIQKKNSMFAIDVLPKDVMHCVISPDSSVVLVGYFNIYLPEDTAKGRLLWVVYVTSDSRVRGAFLPQCSNIEHWYDYGEASFNPSLQNTFIIGGSFLDSGPMGMVSEHFGLCIYQVDIESSMIRLSRGPVQPEGIQGIQHLSHSPDGTLCILAESTRRDIYILSAHTLQTLHLITEQYITSQLHTELRIYSLDIERKRGMASYRSLMLRIKRSISSCNAFSVSRGGRFLCFHAKRLGSLMNRDQVVVMRIPVQIQSLMELCKRQILQWVPYNKKEAFDFPTGIREYIFQ